MTNTGKYLLFAILLFSTVVTGCKSGKTTSASIMEKTFVIGKDGLVHSLHPERSFANHPQILAMAWTFDGTPFVTRSYFDFDLSDLPKGAVIHEGKIRLFHHIANNNPGHSKMGGSNAAVLKQITEPWDASAITWNKQPATSDENVISVNESESETQNYEIDVTAMLRQRARHFGFMLKLSDENHYRSLTFGASDAADAALHPKLVIKYSVR